jgi:hypothetical protein
MYRDVSQAAYVTVAVTLVWLGLSYGGLFNRLDQRLVLTYSERFSNYSLIRELIRARANYTASYNPLGVEHVRFPLFPNTLEDFEDMQRRGLLASNLTFVPSNVPQDPSLLRELLQAAWCTSFPPIPGVVPANRTPGCRCVASAYEGLVREAGNASGGASVVQVLGLFWFYFAGGRDLSGYFFCGRSARTSASGTGTRCTGAGTSGPSCGAGRAGPCARRTPWASRSSPTSCCCSSGWRTSSRTRCRGTPT